MVILHSLTIIARTFGTLNGKLSNFLIADFAIPGCFF